MSEGNDPHLDQLFYPSSGADDAAEAAADPFGPSPETAPGQWTPATPRFTGEIPAASEAREGSAQDTGPLAHGLPAQGIPVVSREQIKDAHLAEVFGGPLPEEHTNGTTGPLLPEASEAASSAFPADPFAPDYGASAPLSAVRTAPQDVFSTTQDLDHGAEGSAPAASYPSAQALPTRRTAGRSLATGLRRMMQTDLPTAPLRVVEKLANTPFSRIRRNQESAEARETLNFAVQLAETMFHYGSDAQDVETAIAAACATYGVEDVDVDITNQSVTINYVSDTARPGDPQAGETEVFSHTVVRVVRSWSDNYSGLTATHRLVRTIVEGDLSRSAAERRLKAITAMPKPYPRWLVTFSTILAVGLLTIGIGGSWRGALVASAGFTVAQFLSGKMASWRIPGFFIFAASSGTVTLVAMLVWSLGLTVSPPHIIAAGLIMLLPTLSLVSTIQDAINGFTVTAAGRAIGTGLSFLGLIVGIAVAVSLTAYFGAPKIAGDRLVFDPAENSAMVVFMLLSSALIAVTLQVSPRHILPALVSESVGLALYFLAAEIHVGARMSTMLAALGVGCASAWFARRYVIPQVVLAVPAMTFLLPGLAIFRGMYTFTVDADPLQGLVPLLNASAALMSMAAALVLSKYIMRPFTKELRGRALSTQDRETPEVPGLS